MNRARTRRVALAVLAIVAVALAATASVPLFTQNQGGGQSTGLQTPSMNDSVEGPSEAPNIPIAPFLIALVGFGVLAIAVQFVSDPWKTLKEALAVVAFIGLLLGVVRLIENLDMSGSESNPQISAPGTTTVSNGTTGYGQGTGDALSLPFDSLVVLVLLAVIVLAVGALFLWRSDTLRTALSRSFGSTEDSEADLDTVGQVAGSAAEEVEAASTPEEADNVIYRTWLDLLDLLEVSDPQSSTPRRFADAAIEAGMATEDVRILTRTFEEVRYGGASLSEDRRERATAALRRIEAAADPGDDTSSMQPSHDAGSDRGTDSEDIG